MEQELDHKIAELKDQLERGDYTIDPGAVADAILRRLRDLVEFHVERDSDVGGAGPSPLQSRCSYPASGALAPSKRTSGRPSATRPIQVIRTLGSALASALSAALTPELGTQTQSS